MTDKKQRLFSLDWRVLLGASLTIMWIGAGLIYLLAKVGWVNFVNLPTGDIGSFLEGAFAPLAFLWLVIGHFMQQSEISANTRAAHLQEQSARRQEMYSRRNSYFRLLSLVQQQLGSIASYHYISVVGPTGSGEVSREEYAAMRTESAHGDPELFVRKMLSLAISLDSDREELKKAFFGTDVRERHSKTYLETFQKLLNSAEAVDHDDMVVNALLHGSPSGLLYRMIRHVNGDEEFNPISGLTGVQTFNNISDSDASLDAESNSI